MREQKLTIGRLAAAAGVTTDTVRFYERLGLIDEPARSPSNYRLYPAGDAARLRFIKRAKELGFSLNEIRELLFLRHDPNATKAEVKARAEAKIKAIRAKINDLTRILAALEQVTAACDGHGPAGDCPILRALSADETEGGNAKGGCHDQHAHLSP